MPSKKTKLNFANDLFLFMVMMSIIGIGFIMQWVLPKGRDLREIYGPGTGVSLWGWDRHDWGKLHLILGLVFVGLLLLHLFLHWSYIKGTFRKYIHSRWLRVVMSAFLLLFGIASLGTWLIPPKITYDGERPTWGEDHAGGHTPEHRGWRGQGRH